MFMKNEYVFYASGGICRIEDVCLAPLDGMPQDRLYYVMHPIHDRNSVMYIPVDSDRVFLRRLMTREEAEELVERIPYITAINEPNSKLLREKYNEAMKTHEPMDWVRVIKTVYLRANEAGTPSRRISETERNFAETARKHLYSELSLALGVPENGMEQYITESVEKNA